jgi:hypothetical protein
MDEESTGGMGFRRTLPAHRCAIHPRKAIPPEITSLFMRIHHIHILEDVVAQLVKARLGEPDCNAAVPGSIPASSTVSWGAAGIMTVYQKSNLRMWGVHSWVKNNFFKKIYADSGQ